MSASHLVLGCDPGLTSGGLVLLEGPAERVLEAHSLVAKIAPLAATPLGDAAFTAAERHARLQAERIAGLVAGMRDRHGPIRAMGLESFVDQPQRVKGANAGALQKERWKAPLAIGHICAALAPLGFISDEGTLVFQSPSILGQLAVELGLLKARRRGDRRQVVCPGDDLLTNDHLQKAWAHGAWLNLRVAQLAPAAA